MQEEGGEPLRLLKAKESGLLLSKEQVERLRDFRKRIEMKMDNFKRLGDSQGASQNLPEKKYEYVKAKHPNIADDVGRNKLDDQDYTLSNLAKILNRIIPIVDCHSGADDKRRSGTLRTVKSLDNLLLEIRLLGKFAIAQLFTTQFKYFLMCFVSN